MKKLLLTPVIFMTICSLLVTAQNNEPKLNQLELSKKIIGVWQEETANDTVMWFEMSLFKNAVLETMYQTVNGVKGLTGAISFTFDPKLDKFKGFWIQPDGKLDSYYFYFTSDKEVEWNRVEDFKSNKLLRQNKFILSDQEMNGTHYDRNKVLLNTSRWIRISSGRIDDETQASEVTQADKQFSQAILNKDIEKMSAWYDDNSIMIFPGGADENGKTEILNGWTTAFKDINFSVKRKLGDVMVPVNGLAYTYGIWERKQSDAQGKVMVVTGKYVETWVKKPDGKWKVMVIKL